MTPFQLDMALQAPVFYMMRRGIRVDQEKKKELSDKAQTEWVRSQALLDEIAGRPVNVNSGGAAGQVAKFLYNELKIPPRRKNKKITTDEDALRAIMAQAEAKIGELKQDQAKERWVRAFLGTKLILKIRGVRKELSSYTGPKVLFDKDGRMRCSISVGGTETMRFSHSKTPWGTGLNLATVAHRLRPMYIADDGYEIAEFDLNRGESWVYTFLSLDPELMRIHLGGGDFHAETAFAIQSAFGAKGLTVEEIRRLAKSGDAFGYKLRYLGKKVNHASSYRMGPFRGAEVVNEESDETNITVTPSQMATAQKFWAQKYIGIKRWWNEIDRQLESTRILTTPYGRVRQFFGFMNDHLKKEATAAVPQSTSVDYLNRGMLRVFNELVEPGYFGLELLHQNHDSILVQYPAQHRDNVFPEIIERLTSTVHINGHDVSIPIEGLYGQNWGDFHEEKNPEGLQEWKG